MADERLRCDNVDQTLRHIPPSPNILRSFSARRYGSHPLHVAGSQLFKDNLLRLRTSFLRDNTSPSADDNNHPSVPAIVNPTVPVLYINPSLH
ncbi:hypothetical protein BVI2075_320299 [Burkholderia vietnamiensis]|nr:hypothetical protein BVI1335_120100 [Burkholderia vietnamiensis]CAG9203750.1 hypothetical protein BVI2075_320299 [Burkholderia vietnamiensis]